MRCWPGTRIGVSPGYRLADSDRPGLAAVRAVEEHPFVPRGRHEMATRCGFFGGAQGRSGPVGELQHLCDGRGELLTAVAVDPALESAVRRASLDQRGA